MGETNKGVVEVRLVSLVFDKDDPLYADTVAKIDRLLLEKPFLLIWHLFV